MAEKNINLTKDEQRRLLAKFLHAGIKSGQIDPTKEDAEIAAQLSELLDNIIAQPSIKLSKNYLGRLLDRARKENEAGLPELSCVLYAAWIEHKINDLIITLTYRQGLEKTEAIQIIRKTAIEDRCSWVLRLLGVQPIKSEYIKKMRQIFDERNSFLHYKWPAEVANNKKEKEFNSKAVGKIAEDIIAYLESYEASTVSPLQETKLLEIVDKMLPEEK